MGHLASLSFLRKILCPTKIICVPPPTFSTAVKWVDQPQKSTGINSFCQRTHNCGELRLSNLGETVELFGWLAFKRMNKFLVIRDSYGQVQTTIPDSREAEFHKIIEKLHYESILRIRGKVVDRGKNRNKKLSTGEIEVEIDNLEVMNAALASLPIFTDDAINESLEHTRLQYRYLDLRSTRMQQNLRLRSKIQHKMRNFFIDQCQFVEVETPTLSQWSPGGANEFVVPAPKPNLGQFYTLPQSPQIYKQLLMCGGIDRYFQMARCYRNEGSKTDRQPEFTQVDLEMSFVTQNDIINIVEALIVASWPEELAKYKPSTPFQRVTYTEAMSKYNSDKPDLRKKSPNRNPFEFLWIVDFPLFTIIDVNGQNKFESTHHPFTAPITEHLNELKAGKNVANIKAQHYDLVLNGVELGGGSIRIHDSSLQTYVLKDILQLPTDTLSRFLEALSFGAPPHGGFALGLDRYVALLAEEYHCLLSKQLPKTKTSSTKSDHSNLGNENQFVTSIRDVIAFPKTKSACCLTMGAPTPLPPHVYKDYGIVVKSDN